MKRYTAPIHDMLFALGEPGGLEEIAGLPGHEDVTPDLVEAILDEGGKFAAEVLAPLNASGDREGARWQDGAVSSAGGFREAYAAFCDNGWHAMPVRPELGGQGLPTLLSTAVLEMCKSANMAFMLCPTLTLGAVEAIAHHGSEALKRRFLPPMVSGRWTGTMNLTEPQAGSDLAALRTRAAPEGDAYRITGTKIFITWGEHDLAENIVHLVLARLPDAPPGVKGISLFLVPKFLVNEDGSLGARNDLACASIEHKLGIHASPTAVMVFGEQAGALGYLLGEPHQGLACMFTMMNHARLGVGLEGVALAERAYQQARAYARERVQGRPIGEGGEGPAKAILHHPDVRRMLMDMKSRTEAMRALAYFVAGRMDLARGHGEAPVRERSRRLVDLLTPVVKGWCTETAIGVASTGIQVHGGVGFIEETGASQHLRDARITAIYEGTTGIQGNDLVGRKLAREGGAAMLALQDDIIAEAGLLCRHRRAEVQAIGLALDRALAALCQATEWMQAALPAEPRAAAAGAVAYLKLVGTVAGGWLMARAARLAAERLAADATDEARLGAKIVTARYFADHVLPEAHVYREAIVNGAGSVLALDEAQF